MWLLKPSPPAWPSKVSRLTRYAGHRTRQSPCGPEMVQLAEKFGACHSRVSTSMYQPPGNRAEYPLSTSTMSLLAVPV